MSLLEVKNLRVTFDTETGQVQAVRGVSFSLGHERLGIVGESGSGKTMTGRAVLRLIRPPGRIEADAMTFDGQDILHCSDREMRALRGKRIGMVMQDPKYSLNPVMTVGRQLTEGSDREMRALRGKRIGMVMQDPKYSLNPVMTVGRQLTEGLRLRDGLGRADATAKAIAALDAVQIRDPKRVMDAYPHELSGGMGQRVMIAMMLIPEPDLLIAFISHDLRLVARFCDRVLVMHKGLVVEEIEAANLLDAKHPYTKGLLNCLPRIGGPRGPLPVLDRAGV